MAIAESYQHEPEKQDGTITVDLATEYFAICGPEDGAASTRESVNVYFCGSQGEFLTHR
jgi:hypothetical protein